MVHHFMAWVNNGVKGQLPHSVLLPPAPEVWDTQGVISCSLLSTKLPTDVLRNERKTGTA